MNEMIFRVRIPVYDVDCNDAYDVNDEGVDNSKLEDVTGFNRENEEVVWDIDPVEGKVLNWNGNSVDLFDKICDSGIYQLLVNGKVKREVDNYVPDFCCLGENGYGDYIKFDVNEDGTIEGWTEAHREAFYEYFGIIDVNTINRFGGFHQWFRSRIEGIEYCEETEDAQVLSPESLIVCKDGSLKSLEELILEALA